MSRRQCDQLLTSKYEKWISRNEERADPPLDERCEGCVEVAFAGPDELEYALVGNPFRDARHQNVVIDSVEKFFEIEVDYCSENVGSQRFCRTCMFCGNGGRATASRDPVWGWQHPHLLGISYQLAHQSRVPLDLAIDCSVLNKDCLSLPRSRVRADLAGRRRPPLLS